MWQIGGTQMEDICKKFPKICESPYKEYIDKDLENNKPPAYIEEQIRKYAKTKDECISRETIRRYKNYMVTHTEITQHTSKETKQSTYELEEELIKKIHQRSGEILLEILPTLSGGNVVQLFLGTGKLLQNMDIISNNTENLSELINDNTKAMLNDRANRSS